MTLPRFLQFITHRGGKSAGADSRVVRHRQQLRRRPAVRRSLRRACAIRRGSTIGEVDLRHRIVPGDSRWKLINWWLVTCDS